MKKYYEAIEGSGGQIDWRKEYSQLQQTLKEKDEKIKELEAHAGLLHSDLWSTTKELTELQQLLSEKEKECEYWKQRCEWSELCITRLETVLPFNTVHDNLKPYDCYAQWQHFKQSPIN